MFITYKQTNVKKIETTTKSLTCHHHQLLTNLSFSTFGKTKPLIRHHHQLLTNLSFSTFGKTKSLTRHHHQLLTNLSFFTFGRTKSLIHHHISYSKTYRSLLLAVDNKFHHHLGFIPSIFITPSLINIPSSFVFFPPPFFPSL